MATSFHLALAEEWGAAEGAETYAPSAFEREGFVHLTDGAAELISTANRYYKGDQRRFVALEVDLDRVGVPWLYEDDRRIYPHVYGRLPVAAVVAVRDVERSPDGAFVALGEAAGR